MCLHMSFAGVQPGEYRPDVSSENKGKTLLRGPQRL